MAALRFWFSCFLILFLIQRTSELIAPLEPELASLNELKFAPRHLLVSGTNAAVLVGAWRKRSHLRPFCRQR